MTTEDSHLLWVPLTDDEMSMLKSGASVTFVIPADTDEATGEKQGRPTLVLIQPPNFGPAD